MLLTDYPDEFSSDKPDNCPCGLTPIIRQTGSRYQIRCPSTSGWDFDCHNNGGGCGNSVRMQSKYLPKLFYRWNEHVYALGSGSMEKCPRCGLHGEHECTEALDFARSGLSTGGY